MGKAQLPQRKRRTSQIIYEVAEASASLIPLILLAVVASIKSSIALLLLNPAKAAALQLASGLTIIHSPLWPNNTVYVDQLLFKMISKIIWASRERWMLVRSQRPMATRTMR